MYHPPDIKVRSEKTQPSRHMTLFQRWMVVEIGLKGWTTKIQRWSNVEFTSVGSPLKYDVVSTLNFGWNFDIALGQANVELVLKYDTISMLKFGVLSTFFYSKPSADDTKWLIV